MSAGIPDQALFAFISVFVVSLVSFAGIFLISIREKTLNTALHVLVGLAAGALLGDAFVHLIPETFEGGLAGVRFSLAILAGIIVFFILEKYLRWHHHEHDAPHMHLPTSDELRGGSVKPVGTLVIVGDGIHNLIDGAIIAASYLVSVPVGIATTVAVFLHEVPQEISDFALLLHAGLTRARALFWNFISALTAFLGAILFLWVGDAFSFVQPIATAFTAGGFIYIAAADLVPELHETKHPGKSIVEFAAMLVGIGVMFALLTLE